MDCRSIDAILDAHRIEALSAAERSEVDSHLERCRRCADAWLGHEILAGETPAAPSPGLLDETLANALDAGVTVTAPRAGRRLAWTLALAATVLVIVALVPRLLPDARPSVETDGGRVPAQQQPGGRPAASAQAVAPLTLVAGFAAGRHYEALSAGAPDASAPGRIEVAEFFMFGCRHCFDFEPALRAWVEASPDYVHFVRVPAMFNATARLHARAFYTAEALGRLDELIEPFYEEIHLRGNPLASVSAIRDFFGRFGVDGRRFDEVFDSPAVETRLVRAEELNRRYRISATPSIGVNGKYVTNGPMAGSNRRMLDVVDALVESEAQALCRGQGGSQCPLR